MQKKTSLIYQVESKVFWISTDDFWHFIFACYIIDLNQIVRSLPNWLLLIFIYNININYFIPYFTALIMSG